MRVHPDLHLNMLTVKDLKDILRKLPNDSFVFVSDGYMDYPAVVVSDYGNSICIESDGGLE